MPIIDTFCDAFRQAITDYETEMANSIPPKRQLIVTELRRSLEERQRDRVDSLRFREEMTSYVRNMPVSTFIFIPLKSRLQEKLQAVLDQPCFSDNQLSIAERDEIRSNHQIEINAVRTRVTELENLLADERAKDKVAKVNELTLALNKERKTTAYLSNENTQLNQSVTNLVNKCKALKKEKEIWLQEKTVLQNENHDLREKYEALLRERQLTNANV